MQLNGQGAANLMAGSDRQILEAAGAAAARIVRTWHAAGDGPGRMGGRMLSLT